MEQKLSEKFQRKTTGRKVYKSLGKIVVDMASMLRPPERLSVSQAAERYRYVNQPGAYVGPWLNSTVPYMVEPMDELTSRVVNAVVFVGPAQSGKTDSLLVNWLVHSAVVDPMDMILYNPSQAMARDFSVRRIDRLHRHTKVVGDQLIRKRDADNTFDKHYVNGMMLTLSWPSVTEFAGRPIGRVALTDYDRMPEDIDGEGSPFDLASKRTTTFQSYAMTLAESSPSRDLSEAGHRWLAKTHHEAPPTTGILALYNRGDRRRWYWPCPSCDAYFEGNFKHLKYEKRGSNLDTAETTYMECPHCAHHIQPNDRKEMQQWGIWLKDGQYINDRNRVSGTPTRSKTASFWLKGVAAAFVSWSSLIELYLNAEDEFESTGSQEALKKFYNTDLAEVYVPRGNDETRLPETLRGRAEKMPVILVEDSEYGIDRRTAPNVEMFRPMVPEGVRFLVALVDVQKSSFVVQVFGICPGAPFDTILIDRFSIYKSARLDDHGDAQYIRPATYLEDWDKITEEVMERTYPLADGSGRKMMIKMTGCDSGGREGVTTNAYNFQRKLRAEGKAGRFHLLKGDPAPTAPRTRISLPDSSQKDKYAVARGDVPVLMLNSNQLKDALNGRLDSLEPGKGMYRMPDWLPDFFFAEMCAEMRTDKGWTATVKRNEGWDLSYYCIALCVSPLLRVEHIDWMNPPNWADVWDKNALVVAAEETKRFAQRSSTEYDFAKLAASMA